MESKSPKSLSPDELLAHTLELRTAELQAKNSQFACACELSRRDAERNGGRSFEVVVTDELQKLMIEGAEIAGLPIYDLRALIHTIFQGYVDHAFSRA